MSSRGYRGNFRGRGVPRGGGRGSRGVRKRPPSGSYDVPHVSSFVSFSFHFKVTQQSLQNKYFRGGGGRGRGNDKELNWSRVSFIYVPTQIDVNCAQLHLEARN